MYISFHCGLEVFLQQHFSLTHISFYISQKNSVFVLTLFLRHKVGKVEFWVLRKRYPKKKYIFQMDGSQLFNEL